jgi:hypothetical protein
LLVHACNTGFAQGLCGCRRLLCLTAYVSHTVVCPLTPRACRTSTRMRTWSCT